MKPAPFEHHSPRTLGEALDLLGGLEDAKVLAGGQSLIPLLNFRLARPAHLVDVNGVAGLDRVYERDGGVAVGALVRQADAERHPAVRHRVPLVAEAIRHVAHPVIRNRGTVVGSLAHADPAAELGAALLALGGSVVAASGRGEREVRAEDLFTGALESSIEPDELITEAWFPAFAGASALVEEARRGGDFALAGVALAGRRMVAFGVAATPVLVDPSDPSSGLEPSGDLEASVEFKLHLVRVLARRALERATEPAALPSLPGPPQEGNCSPPGLGQGFTVNGRPRPAPRVRRRLLSDYLRHELGLTGTHVGCEHGVCGCCTVLLDGRPVRSCLMLAVQAEGHLVTTVEGLAEGSRLHPVQRAFHEEGGLQCGFCTPGFLMATAGLIGENPSPTTAEIEQAIGGNLCRCTGYASIRRAAARAVELSAGAR